MTGGMTVNACVGGLEANGIKVLEDEVLEVKRGGTAVWLAGLADLWTRAQRIEQTIGKIPQGQPIIALTHNPDIFPRVPQRVPLPSVCCLNGFGLGT